MTERIIPSPEEMAACARDADRWRAGLSQSKIASAVMGVPGWSVSEPGASHSQIAHRIAREIITAIQTS